MVKKTDWKTTHKKGRGTQLTSISRPVIQEKKINGKQGNEIHTLFFK